MKIVINTRYGGFGLSERAKELCLERGYDASYEFEVVRNNPVLIAVVEELGAAKASGSYSALKVVEIPDDVEWMIDSVNGDESVVEKHRTWQ